VRGYSSSGVGTVRLEGQVRPSARAALGVTAERALVMTTPMPGGPAETAMSRWEATAGYALVRGGVEIAPFAGAGRRAFAIASSDPARSPDGTYNYAIVGARVARAFGQRAEVRGHAAFEPVLSGEQPTEMQFGGATRWALDVGLAVDVHVTSHVFARAAADVQRFAWSWDGAGARGAGGAVDIYPSGALSLGFDY
jgi:hypothetical protein